MLCQRDVFGQAMRIARRDQLAVIWPDADACREEAQDAWTLFRAPPAPVCVGDADHWAGRWGATCGGSGDLAPLFGWCAL
jgi:hypothetical protein